MTTDSTHLLSTLEHFYEQEAINSNMIAMLMKDIPLELRDDIDKVIREKVRMKMKLKARKKRG
jgi:hypothetical protein